MMEEREFAAILGKLDRLLDRFVSGPQLSIGESDGPAFHWDGTRRCLVPVARPVRIDARELLGIGQIKDAVVRNTAGFLAGQRANNVLLWGERGTGKSSLVKSLLTIFQGTDLRMVQVYKHEILTIRGIYDIIANQGSCRFILFIDDLSFVEGESDYQAMKTIMDGGLQEVPENLLFYATSNRKHLVPTRFADHDGDEVRPADTIEEKVSLADRFGLRFGFYHFPQETYLEIIALYAAKYRLRMERAERDRLAIQWALAAGGRNGRIAEQFVRSIQQTY